MVHIEECSAFGSSKAQSKISSESKGDDNCADKEKADKKQNKNVKDIDSNTDNLNAGILDNGAIRRDSQSVLKDREFSEFPCFDEISGDGNNRNEELKKWAVVPMIFVDFSCKSNEDKSIYSSRRKKNRSEKMKRFQMEIFFASIIEMLCNGEFDGLNTRFRDVLRQVAGRFIHSSYLSEDYGAFRIAIRRRLREILNVATNLKIENSLTVNNTEKKNYFLSSRYSVDFREVRRIGCGGFGQVFHVHSNIDDCDYAIKKIQFNLTMSKSMTKIVNEVRLLAVVQHKNIVRYYGAWVELRDLQTTPSGEDDDCSNDEMEVSWKNSRKNISSPVNACSEFAQMDEDDSEEQFEGWKMRRNISSNRSLTVARETKITNPINLMLPQSGTAIMFVQMELCSRTLNDYFTERNAEIRPKKNRQLNRSIMEQLMSAVAHLHSKKIIHRDIKPSNIFLRNESSSPIPSILLGDFGLACLHQNKMVRNTIENETITTHSEGVGTSLYAAPEQQNSTAYDNAVDVYSAGIVFFELCVPFFTQMERLKIIGKLKKGKLSEEFKISFPEEAMLIQEMCRDNPQKRPNASEIVTKLGKIGENTESLKDRIQELEKEIVRLRNLLLNNNITEI
ncbi:Eukaryotic translation initiation factor 2-alpha kinase [Dirofilaria immitis]